MVPRGPQARIFLAVMRNARQEIHDLSPEETTNAAPSPPSTNRNSALDGLRGFLAVVVCVYHGIWVLHVAQLDRIAAVPIYQEKTLTEIFTRLYFGILNGDFAVVVFFVMSGAVLQLSLRRSAAAPAVVQCGEFAVARVLRIYPALVTTLLLFWGAFVWLHWQVPDGYGIYFTPAQLAENITLHKIAMYGVSWSLRVEILMVPVILLAFYARRAFGDVALVILAVLAVLLYENPALLFDWQDVTGHLLPFALGFMVPTRLGEETARVLRSKGALAAIVVLDLHRLFVPYHQYSSVVVHAVCAYLLVTGVYHASWPKLVGILSAGPMRFLGRISYSYYLLNPVFLEILARTAYHFFGYRENGHNYVGWGAAVGFVSAVLTVPLASLSERYVEAPANRLAKRLRRPWTRPVAAEPAA